MNSSIQYDMDQVIQLRPKVQTLLQKWVLQPFAERLTLNIANMGNLSPRHVTFISGGLGTLAALAFLSSMNWLGMLLFLVAIILDLVDGKLARLTGSGTAFGIMLDAFSDIYRVALAALAVIVAQDQLLISSLMLIFVALHFGEFLINQDIHRVHQLWKTQTIPAISSFELHLLRQAEKLKEQGLKLIFLHYQERLFILFGMGAITGNWSTWILVAILITLVNLYLKYHFDLALVKQHLNPESDEVEHA